jgi:hypothetical protein
MAELPDKGEKVKWDTPQGETHGTVEKIVTSTTKVKGHTVKATKDHPEVEVRSEKSNKKAIHKPEELKKG